MQGSGHLLMDFVNNPEFLKGLILEDPDGHKIFLVEKKIQ
jgi:hypothetical protein